MGGSPGKVREVPVTKVKQRKSCKMTCDEGEAVEGLENELWRSWSAYDVGEATEGLENELWRSWSAYDVGEATGGL